MTKRRKGKKEKEREKRTAYVIDFVLENEALPYWRMNTVRRTENPAK